MRYIKRLQIFLFFLIIVGGLTGCQNANSTGNDTGTLQVNVSWQTEVWKPGSASTVLLPDTEVRIHKMFSNEIFRNGVTDLLGIYRDEALPAGWYWVEANHQPAGVQKSDYGKHWVTHFVHIQPGKETVINFRYENAGGWKVK